MVLMPISCFLLNGRARLLPVHSKCAALPVLDVALLYSICDKSWNSLLTVVQMHESTNVPLHVSL
jgi:hypothetical protein